MHLHPKIVKEDAFFGFDTISLTRGQVDPRFRFAKNKKPRLVLEFGKRRGGGWKASDKTRKTRIRSLAPYRCSRKNVPHSEYTRIAEVIE